MMWKSVCFINCLCWELFLFFITQLKNISAMETWNSSASLSAAEIWISDVLLCLKLGLWHSQKSHMVILLLQIQNINVENTIILGNLQLICTLCVSKISTYLIFISFIIFIFLSFITSTINICKISNGLFTLLCFCYDWVSLISK